MLTIRSLEKVFNPNSVHSVHSLRGVDLEVESGEFVTIIGSNGAGKTTLFNLIAGVYEPSYGSIVINGVDVTRWPEHQRAALIGRVFQDPLMGTADRMTIAENLTLALLRAQRLRLKTGVTSDRRKIFIQLLEPLDLGLEMRLDSRVNLLSGGQRQALTLLMASLTHPKLLLLDEHTAALDPATANKILLLTRELIERDNLTAIMITHNLKLALDYGNRILMLDRGSIVMDLDKHEKRNLSYKELLDRFNQIREGNNRDEHMLTV